jgi:hypothetical protein
MWQESIGQRELKLLSSSWKINLFVSKWHWPWSKISKWQYQAATQKVSNCQKKPIFSNIDLDLDHRHLLDPYGLFIYATYRPNLVSMGQSKLLSKNYIFLFSNSDLDLYNRPQWSNPQLPSDIIYLYKKFGVNRPK